MMSGVFPGLNEVGKGKLRIFFTILPALKIDSWSFEGFIILLIYFLNCRKALFTEKQLSFSKMYRV